MTRRYITTLNDDTCDARSRVTVGSRAHTSGASIGSGTRSPAIC